MTSVSTYHYEVNAIYVHKMLNQLGINSTINEIVVHGKPIYEIYVNPDNIQRAKTEINKMDIDDFPTNEFSEGYIAGNQEWAENMYNPGHYTGGKAPNYLTNKANWKFLAPCFIFGGLFLGYFYMNDSSHSGFENLPWIGLYIGVGISMIWQLKKNRKTLSNKK